jgi:isocitrate/isopropylmalate dehydrogenase
MSLIVLRGDGIGPEISEATVQDGVRGSRVKATA